MSSALTGTTEIGVVNIPVDPTNSGNYTYGYGATPSAAPNSYTLEATLEDPANAALKGSIHSPSSNGIDCSASSTYCISL